MLQFFVGNPEAANAARLAPPSVGWHRHESLRKKLFLCRVRVLESGIEVKSRTKQMFLYPIPNRGKDISFINTLKFLLRKQARMIVCHTIEEL